MGTEGDVPLGLIELDAMVRFNRLMKNPVIEASDSP